MVPSVLEVRLAVKGSQETCKTAIDFNKMLPGFYRLGNIHHPMSCLLATNYPFREKRVIRRRMFFL